MDRKRGDSRDVTQQWQEVTSDQHRLARSRSNEPTNIPAEEINMEHKQSRGASTLGPFGARNILVKHLSRIRGGNACKPKEDVCRKSSWVKANKTQTCSLSSSGTDPKDGVTASKKASIELAH